MHPDESLTPLRLRPSCHRCGSPFLNPTDARCPRCFDETRAARKRALRWRIRLPLWALILLIAVCALMFYGGLRAWRHHLADDSHEFLPHEQEAIYQAFLESAFTHQAEIAEARARSGQADTESFLRQAADFRAKAASCARFRAEYEWRARLKHEGW
ncbi:MAG: hypothetical protein ACYC61_09045 [Isosphaeraceae bacterium]